VGRTAGNKAASSGFWGHPPESGELSAFALPGTRFCDSGTVLLSSHDFSEERLWRAYCNILIYLSITYRQHKLRPGGWRRSAAISPSGGVSTNEIERYFALLNRCITGSIRSVSRTRLQNNCVELSLRWNERKATEPSRVQGPSHP
jgi:hypothetical protein